MKKLTLKIRTVAVRTAKGEWEPLGAAAPLTGDRVHVSGKAVCQQTRPLYVDIFMSPAEFNGLGLIKKLSTRIAILVDEEETPVKAGEKFDTLSVCSEDAPIKVSSVAIEDEFKEFDLGYAHVEYKKLDGNTKATNDNVAE